MAIRPGRLQQTRFGNRATLLGSDPGQRVTLLNTGFASDVEQENHAWETWVFSWNVEVDYGAALLCPLLAEISLGAGGSRIAALINLVPSGSIQLPSTVASINLLWDLALQSFAPPISTLPTSCIVDGVMRKGATLGNARRNVVIVEDGAGLIPDAIVPPFATDWQVYGPAVAYDPATRYDVGTGPSTTYSVTGPEADAQRARGGTFELVGGVDRIRVGATPPAPTFFGNFNFRIRI